MTFEVQYLTSENSKICVINGRVNLKLAAKLIKAQGGDEFPAPTHGWMRDAPVPEGEDADWWREVCQEGDEGAEPVTLSVLAW